MFSLEEGERGETDILEMTMDTGQAEPQKQGVRRMPYVVRQEVARQLETMQKSGVIQPSCSLWASPVVMVRKKDGSYRFCVDHRKLNAVTRTDVFPLPQVDDLLDQFGNFTTFQSLTLQLDSGRFKWRALHKPRLRLSGLKGCLRFE